MLDLLIWIATQRKEPKLKTLKGGKTRLYQIVHTTNCVFLIVELEITQAKMGLETYFFNDQQNALHNMLCQTKFSLFQFKVLFAMSRHRYPE